MAKKENIFKRIWNFLGDNEESLSEEEKEEVKVLNSNTKEFRKEMVAEVKPIDINDIVPEPQQEKSLEREDRE